jgi:hypothetical protein
MWTWLGAEIEAGNLQISAVALGEVHDVSPDCGAWLDAVGVTVVQVEGADLVEANRVKTLLEIPNDQYGAGVDENDLLIIAAAKRLGVELISNEALQATLPANKSRYKIPAVCNMQTVNVACSSFLDFIKGSQQVFKS